MKNIPLLLVTLLGTVALIIGIAAFFSSTATKQVVEDQAVLVGDARNSSGPQSAQVTVVEFSDLQCPACRAMQPLVKEIKDKYPDKVKVVYRHFPLANIHPYATLAAQATEVAAEKGKFWEMHDMIFEKQETWVALESADQVQEEFAKYAQELQIDKAAFLERIQSDEIKQRVAKDVADGSKINIQATPTFYVNGQKVPAPTQLLPTVESLLQ